MAQRLLIAHPWLSDQATVAATSEAASMPASNLVRRQAPSDAWRAINTVGLSIDVHLPEVDLTGRPIEISWDFVAPLYTNSSEDATWRIIAAPTQAELDSGPTFSDAERPCWTVPNMIRPGEPEWRHAFRWLPVPRTEPWLRIYWDDPAPIVPTAEPTPFVQWGRLFVSLAWRPTYSRDRGAGLFPAAESARKGRTFSGATRRGKGPKPRKYRFNVGNLSHAEAMTRGYELARVVGESGQILVIDDPTDANYLDRKFIVGQASQVEFKHEDFETNSVSYSIEEDL